MNQVPQSHADRSAAHPVRVAENLASPQTELEVISRHFVDLCELEGLAQHPEFGHLIV